MDPDLPPISPHLPRLAAVVSRFGRWYNGYSVSGIENIPLDRPALIVFYHGFMPLDAWYFLAWFYRRTGVVAHGLGDRFLFRTPGLASLVRAMGGVEATPENGLRLLRAGRLVGVSPGGVREALAGRGEHYKVLWGHRAGFARLAVEAKVDVIPAFSENVEELYRAPGADRWPFPQIYERTRLPIVPVVGLGALPFPVRLRSHIGEPIPYDPQRTPEELRDLTRDRLQALIDRHQGGRPRILRGLAQRVLDRAP